MSNPYAKPIATNPDEYRNQLLKRMHQRDRVRDVAREILSGIPDDGLPAFQGLEFNGNILQSKIVAYFRVEDRDELIPLIEALPPLPLVQVVVKYDHREEMRFWPSTYTNTRVEVLKRRAIAPFIYHVEQTRNHRHNSLTWLARFGETVIAIKAHITNDPAKFEVNTQGRVGERQQARWERNTDFPVGYTTGNWNKWRPYYELDEVAHCTIYWVADKLDPHTVDQGPVAIAASVLEVVGRAEG